MRHACAPPSHRGRARAQCALTQREACCFTSLLDRRVKCAICANPPLARRGALPPQARSRTGWSSDEAQAAVSRQAGSAVAPGPLGPRPAFPAWCRELLRVLRELKSIKMTQSDSIPHAEWRAPPRSDCCSSCRTARRASRRRRCGTWCRCDRAEGSVRPQLKLLLPSCWRRKVLIIERLPRCARQPWTARRSRAPRPRGWACASPGSQVVHAQYKRAAAAVERKGNTIGCPCLNQCLLVLTRVLDARSKSGEQPKARWSGSTERRCANASRSSASERRRSGTSPGSSASAR